MKTRKVTIINSKTQSQKVIQDSRATTLGELKAEMRNEGIDFSDMTFFEGHMRAELKDDAAPLPTNIPYNGQVVNDLVFLLTTPEKKIKSGTMSRAEAYNKVREMGLQGACVDKFGKNFTQCTTADLISLIENNTVKAAAPKAEKPKAEKPVDGAPVAPETPATDCNCLKALAILTGALYENCFIDSKTHGTVMDILNEDIYSTPEKMSKKEIDKMFDFV